MEYTRFDCKVAGGEAERLIRLYMDAVKAEQKVLLSFRVGDLWIDPFLYEKGERQGQPGASLKGRLFFIDWIKVNGSLEYKAPARQEATAPAEQTSNHESSSTSADAEAEAQPTPRTAGRDASSADKLPINLHADEFNELMGDEFIPLINKGGGAGIQVTAYTQTLSDIEARIGNRAKAGQVIGNFNTLQMLRVRETATAELLTQQLPKINVLTKTLVSGATDTSNPEANTDFTSSSQDRVSSNSVPLIEPAHIVSLPKGQMFSFQVGGQLWKVRMPLPKPSPDDAMPKSLQELAQRMRASCRRDTGGARAGAVRRSTSIQIGLRLHALLQQ